MAKKEIERDDALEQETDHAEPRVYELGFHIDPELPQEEAKKTYQNLRSLIASHGEIIAEGEAEKISLAYTISRMETTGRRDFNSAYFGWIAYETTGEGHEEIVAATRAESRVFRFLDLRTSRDAAKHSAEMHEFYRRAPEGSDAGTEEEEPADAELDAALKEAGVEA